MRWGGGGRAGGGVQEGGNYLGGIIDMIRLHQPLVVVWMVQQVVL